MSIGVIRLDSNGPERSGLAFWGNCESEDVVAGDPVETGHEFFSDSTGQLTSGVWECTAYTANVEAYPVDEFCYILDGTVTITESAGRAETFTAGDCFVIPKGLKFTWHMPETVRKFYVIFDRGAGDGSGTSPDNAEST